MITRRRFLRTTAAVAGGLGLYTWRVEPHWLEVVERQLPIPDLPEHLRGHRIVQLSDLHIGPRVDDSFLFHTFALVKKLSPEIVVYTGDFTSYEADGLGHAARVMRELPLGSKATLGVLGNHDYGQTWQQTDVADGIVKIASSAGVRVLRNEIAEVDGLQIAGLDDLWAHRFKPRKALPELKSERPALVLSHNPDSADEPGWGSYAGWILSGHTHGGQCKAPFLPPPLLPVRNRRFVSGEYSLTGGRRIYISRGVGHLLKVRFNARPEITVFHLAAA